MPNDEDQADRVSEVDKQCNEIPEHRNFRARREREGQTQTRQKLRSLKDLW